MEAGSNEAADCMADIADDSSTFTLSTNLCFDDGVQPEAENPLSGLYSMADVTYNDRHFWMNEGGYYLYYDAVKRFWVIDDKVTIFDKLKIH